MVFSEKDQVIDALASNRADNSLSVRVLPGRSRSGDDLSDAHPLLWESLSVRRGQSWAFARFFFLIFSHFLAIFLSAVSILFFIFTGSS